MGHGAERWGVWYDRGEHRQRKSPGGSEPRAWYNARMTTKGEAMDRELTLAERVEALELEVAFLKRQLAQLTANPNWIDQVSGIMKDEPAFAEVVRLGKEFRQAQVDPSEDDS